MTDMLLQLLSNTIAHTMSMSTDGKALHHGIMPLLSRFITEQGTPLRLLEEISWNPHVWGLPFWPALLEFTKSLHRR